jgi:sugar lactone lactonase YvrE
MRAVTGAIVCAGLACTAPNPAYHLEDVRPGGPGDQPQPPRDATIAADTAQAADAAAPADAAPVSLTAVGAFGIASLDSLAIDRDGTIYFDQNDGVNVWIGRRRPGVMPETRWVSVPMAFPTRGMALDSTNRILYFTAAVPSAAALEAIDVDAMTPAARIVIGGFSGPNDLAMGSDGSVYVSEQLDGHIYRVTAAGVRSKVTKTPLGDPANTRGPAGLTFGPDGWLYVGAKTMGPIVRLQLTNGVEVKRANYGKLDDWGNGLAFDQAGRLYVALWSMDVNKSVVRLDSDTAAPVTVLTGHWFSGMAFGRGALDPRWLFVAEPQGPLHRIDTDTPGLPAP